MPPTAPLSNAINRLWLPRTSLSTCLRGVMARSTLGLELTEAQRFNYFPASPLCVINWWFHGSSELLPSGTPVQLDSAHRTTLSGVIFSGPQTRPCVSWCPGPAHGMMLLFMPDALHQLTGIDVPQTVNRFINVREIFPSHWVDFFNTVAAQADDDQRVVLIQDFLEPLWNATRPKQPMQAHRVRDWAQALALRAATSGAGRSLRQVERRIKQWAGQPLRELRGMGRAEHAFFEGLAAAEQGQHPNWAAVAESSGYADQSHLCRETRRVTGFAPDELYRRMASDEGFWSYRLWA
ncbi:MAG: helix-turn-helix transcriptional regulator [Rhizobacter sp.]